MWLLYETLRLSVMVSLVLGSPEKKLESALDSENLHDAINTFVEAWKERRKDLMKESKLSLDTMVGDDPSASLTHIIGGSLDSINPTTSGSGSLKELAESTIKDTVIVFRGNSKGTVNMDRQPVKVQTKLKKLLPKSSMLDDKKPKSTSHKNNNGQSPGTQSFPRNCSQCFQRELYKKWRLDTIKLQILRKLRMTKPPNITGTKIPKLPLLARLVHHSQDMQGDDPGYRYSSSSENEDDFHATTIKVINFCQPLSKGLGINSTETCHFKFQPQVLQSKITRAHMWVYIKPAKKLKQKRKTIEILIYKILPPNTQGSSYLRVRVKSRHSTRNGGWYRFDFKSIVQGWINSGTNLYGLQIFACHPRCNGKRNSLAVVQPHTDHDEEYRPFLEIKIQEKRSARKKRNPGLECDETSLEERCCRYPLTVDFTEFGWDWIIAPKTYKANFCSGDCPPVFLQRQIHTHVIQKVNPLGFDGPCCTASKLSSMTLLYFDGNKNILFGKLPGVIVDRCGCE